MLHRAPATTTYESGIDWRFVQSLDPVMIQQTRDFNSMQEFVNSFMGSEINQGDRNVLCHPLSHKLALLSQVTIKYMFDCQDQLKKRIAELEGKIPLLQIIDPKTLQAGDRIVFGATVELEDDDGQSRIFQIVGDDEADIKAGRISISSPLARSLIGKYEGDEVTCPAPKGLIHYAIVTVKYV